MHTDSGSMPSHLSRAEIPVCFHVLSATTALTEIWERVDFRFGIFGENIFQNGIFRS